MRERAEAKRARLIDAGAPERTRDAQFGGPSRASLKKRVGKNALWEEIVNEERTGMRAAPACGEEAESATSWWWAVSKLGARPRPDTEIKLTHAADGARLTLRVDRVSCGTIDSARISAIRRASGTMIGAVVAKPQPKPAARRDAAVSKEVGHAFESAKDVFLEL